MLGADYFTCWYCVVVITHVGVALLRSHSLGQVERIQKTNEQMKATLETMLSAPKK